MNNEVQEKINDLIRVSGLKAFSEGDFSKHLNMCIEAWGLLPEPKMKEQEAFHIINFILILGMKLNNLEVLDEWRELLLKASPDRIDSGEREFKVAKVELFLGNEEKAFDLLKIANKKSGGRCFGLDKTIKPFFQNYLKNSQPKSKEVVKETKKKVVKPCSKQYTYDFEGNILKLKLKNNKQDWLLQKKYKNTYEIAPILMEDEELEGIERLIIGYLDDGESYQDILDIMISNADSFKRLRSLVIGGLQGEESYLSGILQCNYNYFWEPFNQVQSLSIVGTEGLILGDIKHSNLKHLEIISSGMPSNVFEDIIRHA